MSGEMVIFLFRTDCKTGMFSLCDVTNDSKLMETLYGHRICGAFGYSHLTGTISALIHIELKLSYLSLGGYDGCQAEWVRVPFADVNLLKIENDRLTDEQVLFLSDIVCTG
jgi:threonine dehydrogenase-like Zn-dependent dehydrogenase